MALTLTQPPAQLPTQLTESPRSSRGMVLQTGDCDWWDFACQGADAVVDTGMSVVTTSSRSPSAAKSMPTR